MLKYFVIKERNTRVNAFKEDFVEKMHDYPSLPGFFLYHKPFLHRGHEWLSQAFDQDLEPL